MSLYTHIRNVPDFKNGNGKWLKSYNPFPYEKHSTRAGILWCSINSRCRVGGCFQNEHHTYIGTTNGFHDFQEFAEWCQEQYGYLYKEENGRFWSLDKDLTEYGNKEYCKEKCLFIPHRINNLLIRGSTTNDFSGVDWDKQANKFRSRCKNWKGKCIHLGYFSDKFSAHQAWQKAKIEVMEDMLMTDIEIKQHTKLVPIIKSHIQRIQDDLNNNRETA